MGSYTRAMSEGKSAKLSGHAYLIAGTAHAISSVADFLAQHGIELKHNPDVYVREYKGFGIEEARELRDRALTRAIAGPRRVFIVVSPGMTTDAQNALLKTLEEPSAGAIFFFIVPSPMTLLPTLRSRAQILRIQTSRRSPDVVDAKTFLAATVQMRLDMLKPLYQKDENDERDIRQALTFLNELELIVSSQKINPHRSEGIAAVYRARKYITDKGSLIKPLLEQVALLTPRS